MKVKSRSAKTLRRRKKARYKAAVENAFKSKVRQALEAVMNGGKLPKMCKQYGVPRSIVQSHIKEERGRSPLEYFQASTAEIPLNSKKPENINDKNTLKKQKKPKITQNRNVQLAVKDLGSDRDVVNKTNVTTDADLGTDERMSLKSLQEPAEIETRKEISKMKQKSLGLEHDAGDCFRECPQTQPTSPVKKIKILETQTLTKSSVDKQRNIDACKTKEERDRRKSSVDTWLAFSRFDTMLGGDVSLRFTSDGDYVNDHDYLRSPYMRCRMVQNQYCVCVLCGKRQLMGMTHVKHMRKHKTKCRLCNKQFDDIFLMNLHAYSHCYYCNECKTNVFYYSYDSHSSGRCIKPTKHYVLLANTKAKNASGNTHTMPKQGVGEPSHGLKLLLEQPCINKDPKVDEIWNLIQSPASSTTEITSFCKIFNSTVVPDNNPILSKAGSELKIVNPNPGEKTLLIDYEEEIIELCGGSKTKEDSTRPSNSVTDILVGSKAADDKPSKVLDNSNLPLLENPPEQENSSISEQNVSTANLKECSTSAKEPTNNEIVYSRNNTRNKSQHHEISEIYECIDSLIKLGEVAPPPSYVFPDVSTKLKLSKIPLVLEPNVRKSTFMDGTKEQEKLEV